MTDEESISKKLAELNRRSTDTEIEHIKQDIHELKERDEKQSEAYTRRLEQIEHKLDDAISQLDMYRHFTIFIRAVLVGVVMIVTLKFGDIKDFFMGDSP